MFEGADMFPQGGSQVFCIHKAQIVATGIDQDIAEGMHAAEALGSENNVIGGIAGHWDLITARVKKAICPSQRVP